jgi:hypothetical protein
MLTMLPTCFPDRWINPLMGWTSSADPMENVTRSSMAFNTKEDAIAFAAKHGWEVASVEEPNVRRLDRQKRYQNYGDKFRWVACLPLEMCSVAMTLQLGLLTVRHSSCGS